jgi:hypothetical protein
MTDEILERYRPAPPHVVIGPGPYRSRKLSVIADGLLRSLLDFPKKIQGLVLDRYSPPWLARSSEGGLYRSREVVDFTGETVTACDLAQPR